MSQRCEGEDSDDVLEPESAMLDMVHIQLRRCHTSSQTCQHFSLFIVTKEDWTRFLRSLPRNSSSRAAPLFKEKFGSCASRCAGHCKDRKTQRTGCVYNCVPLHPFCSLCHLRCLDVLYRVAARVGRNSVCTKTCAWISLDGLPDPVAGWLAVLGRHLA